MTERVQKAIDILVKAINNDELHNGSCTSCLVGNLVCESMGYKQTRSLEWRDKNGIQRESRWDELFVTPLAGQSQELNLRKLQYPEIREQIDSTNFTWQELAKMENIFENASGDVRWETDKALKRKVLISATQEALKYIMSIDKCPENIIDVFTKRVCDK